MSAALPLAASPFAPSASVPQTPAQDHAAPRAGLAITLQRLSRRFGDKRVLDSIDLHIPAGQFVAIVGKSGCGKSTLLRLLAGLDEPTGGRIVHDGAAEGAVTRIMFQEPRLLPWERVLSNVEVGLPPALKGEARQARARAMLEAVGLSERAGEWPAVLSGGQKQRVALARALASGPRLLALDEPLGALDALTRIEMQGLVERIWREQHFTAILVTHDVSEALALADRVILIDGGRIALDLDVPLPRPRPRGSAELAALEGRILDRLFAA
ncbi:ATP-binding cassette domain-containing protein [Segnochrobactrum spirostomi]|uniref:ATP-binding cassette domain-containing protein n=1 Tax=Segnochrobactrum spirostomi TaxID=2608987 RepID=A0A6A7Y482_9HYPH|nr:ATP-binding cassette domain-containing protein [Segnochrobactrum spirostomi]MQT12562.1 ATP-binding cassette domain-containing protein [Segnochrobactrum spirostomi]